MREVGWVMAVNSGGIPAAEVDELEASGEAESREGREREEVGWAFRLLLLVVVVVVRTRQAASSTEQREEEEEREQHRRAKGTRG